MYPRGYSDQGFSESLMEKVFGEEFGERLRTFGSILWTGLKWMMPLQFLVLLAIQNAMPDGVTPMAKFDGESRWTDLGAMPVLVFVFALIIESLVNGQDNKWKRFLATGVICSAYMLLTGGAAMGFLVLGMWFGATLAAWLSWPWLRRAGKALARNRDVQEAGVFFWAVILCIGTVVTLGFAGVAGKLDPELIQDDL